MTPFLPVGTPVVNSPIPFPLMNTYVPSLDATVPYASAFLYVTLPLVVPDEVSVTSNVFVATLATV